MKFMFLEALQAYYAPIAVLLVVAFVLITDQLSVLCGGSNGRSLHKVTDEMDCLVYQNKLEMKSK